MIIEHTDGKIINTSTLTDIDALFLEEANKFKNLCVSHNRVLFLTVSNNKVGKDGSHGMHNFWNLISKENMNDKDIVISISDVAGCMDNFLRTFTNNELQIVKVNNE